MESVLTSVDTPLGPEFVPDMRVGGPYCCWPLRTTASASADGACTPAPHAAAHALPRVVPRVAHAGASPHGMLYREQCSPPAAPPDLPPLLCAVRRGPSVQPAWGQPSQCAGPPTCMRPAQAAAVAWPVGCNPLLRFACSSAGGAAGAAGGPQRRGAVPGRLPQGGSHGTAAEPLPRALGWGERAMGWGPQHAGMRGWAVHAPRWDACQVDACHEAWQTDGIACSWALVVAWGCAPEALCI